ncbi:MAG: DUF3098 domain-containing protein [Bacteroidota bacterium]|nr:DUF3098 domain-containing protein [Bacteroidota bacterium]
MAKKANIANRRGQTGVNKANTDRPVQNTQAPNRPIQPQNTRVLASKVAKPSFAGDPFLNPAFPLTKRNLILMFIGLGIIIVGFLLMAGQDDKYGFVKISLANMVVLGGFLFEIYAIMWRPKSISPSNIPDSKI